MAIETLTVHVTQQDWENSRQKVNNLEKYTLYCTGCVVATALNREHPPSNPERESWVVRSREFFSNTRAYYARIIEPANELINITEATAENRSKIPKDAWALSDEGIKIVHTFDRTPNGILPDQEITLSREVAA